MDNGKHKVILPISDYQNLIQRPDISPIEFERMSTAARSWGVNRIEGVDILAMTSFVSNWDNLKELVIFDRNNSKLVLKRYKLIAIGGHELDENT